MKWQLLAPWWFILPYTTVVLLAVGWQITHVRHEGRLVVLKWVRRASVPFLVTAMMLGPSVPGGTSAPGIANLDVLFAVDTTASMGAQDYAGTQLRLDGVKKDLVALGSKLQGAHLALITFDSDANLVLPFTTNSSTFATAVQTMNREVDAYSRGSAIDKPISLINQELKNNMAAYPERTRLIFYLGDGEQTVDAPVKSFSSIAPYVSGGGVLGYGTAKGATMLKYTGIDSPTSTSPSYVTTPNSTGTKLVPAISKIDESALKKIAGQLGVTYQNRDRGGSIDSAFKSSKAPLLIDRSQHVTRYINLYWLVAIPFAGLLFWEWKGLLLKLLELRRQSGKGHNA